MAEAQSRLHEQKNELSELRRRVILANVARNGAIPTNEERMGI